MEIYFDANAGEYYEREIPQAQIKIGLWPGFGSTKVKLHDWQNRLIKTEEIKWEFRNSSLAQYIENILNKSMTEILKPKDSVYSLSVLTDLQCENKRLKEEKDRYEKDLERIREIISHNE